MLLAAPKTPLLGHEHLCPPLAGASSGAVRSIAQMYSHQAVCSHSSLWLVQGQAHVWTAQEECTNGSTHPS